MVDNIGPLFFKEKQVKLMLALADSSKEWHLSELAKNTDTTYVHTSKFISKCESMGLITSEKHGKIKTLKLTEKGIGVANNIANIVGIIGVAPQKAAGQAAKTQE